MKWLKHVLRKILVIVLTITVIMNINAFSSIVSDSDGGAFITKEEFHNLKDSFSEQINGYNLSIDNKIDGAIASYLSGIQLANSQELTNYYKNYENNNGIKLYWANNTTAKPTELVNYGRWIITSNFMLGTMGSATSDTGVDRVGRRSGGYAYSLEDYNNKGYMILKTVDSKVVGRVKYSPTMETNVTYIYYTNSSSWSATMSSWSSLCHLGVTQLDSGKSMTIVGNMNNYVTAYQGPGFRSFNVSVSLLDALSDFYMYPQCTAGVAIWKSDDTTSKTSEGSGATSSPIWQSTTEGDLTISSVGGILYMPHYTEQLPWITNSQTLNEQIVNILNVTGVDVAAMKYGLPITKVDKDGTLIFSTTPAAGNIGWYICKAGDAKKTWADIPNERKRVCDGMTQLRVEEKVEKGDCLWFIYLPNTPSRLEMSSLSLVLDL